MAESLAKRYNPKEFEERWYRFWEERGFFTAHPEEKEEKGEKKERFCLVIPPPNVTGTLHMGHAFEDALMDCVVRWKRMQGLDTLWLPGTDHAGIATQIVVEQELAKEGKARHELGREKFVERVWKWKQESGGVILKQLRRMGASCDWSRERFTMEPALSRAVQKVFVELYREGLVYRGKYIVNWCPRCQTALSDLEASDSQHKGSLWYVRYPAAGGEGGIVVATTRPETMLGDTGVAVHPEDERYGSLLGKKVMLPLVGREIPVVADPFVDKEFGTGAVKVTPAHDANDFEAGKRCGLPSLLVMNKDGTMNEAAGEDFQGLDRFEAREKILKLLEEQGFLEKTEDYEHIVKHCGRCDTVIEPYLSTQWFVKVKPLAERAVEAVEKGQTKVVPEKWKKTYFEWLRNIHDWCISRQIWWGHPVPAWHCACGEFLVAGEKPASACAKCGKGDWTPDPDVLDTWFSSQLWPFSTLGWPEETRDLKTYYPTTLLITGFDILFFWVARMMMAGLHFMKDVPFREVYIHGLVRDAKGQKMSKSRGNTVDPLDFIEKYGADSLRFTFLAMATPGMDVPLNEQRVVGYRAFCTKLWNAVRFALMNIDENARIADKPPASLPERWLLSRLARTVEEVNASFADYRFDHAANELYHFLWDEFCDWFVEISKPALAGDDAEAKRSAQSTLLLVLDRVLRLLHPFMPFITEELWQKLPASVRDAESLCVAAWPHVEESWFDKEANDAMDGVKSVVTEIRSVRALLQVDPKEKIEIAVLKNDTSEERLSTHGAMISNLARLKAYRLVQTLPQKGVPVRVWNLEMRILLEDVEHSAVRARLEKNLADVSKQHKALATKLENPLFVKRAPAEVVMDTRARQSALEKKIPRIKEIIEALR